jgi:hypothetical protein
MAAPQQSVLPNSYLDLVPSGLSAALPSNANMAAIVPPGRTAFYYATDTKVLHVFNPTAGQWDTGVVFA